MAEFVVTDPESGKTLKLTGDSPPTEQELEELFADTGERSFAQNVGRGVGLAARALTETPGLIAAGVGDIAARGLNVGIGGLDVAGQALGDEPIEFRFPTTGTERVERGFTGAGFPQPESPLERVGLGVGRALVGAGAPIAVGTRLAGAASPVTAGVGEALQAGRTLQGVSAGGSAAAGETVREAGGGPGAQTIASLAGALAPTVGVTAGPAIVRRAIRGRDPAAVQETIETFARAGTTPSVAQATQGRIAQATESLLARTPGGAGRITSAAQRQTDQVASRVEQIADDLAPKSTAERAGRAIEAGISGRKGFVARFQDKAGKLYDDVDQHLDTSGPAPINKTRDFLLQKTTPVKGAEETSQLLSSKFLDDISTALDTDLKNALEQGVDGLPYETIKSLRSRVGEKLNSLSLIDDASKADLKRLYGSLSEDLTSYAKTQGTAAERAARRADAFYKSGRDRIDALENVVNKNGGPEKIFNAAIAGTKEGATTLRTVMKSLRSDEKRMLAAAVVRRMGKATPGQQDVTGEAFSIGTYLTNWARLSPEARGALFGRFGPKFSKDMNALAQFASNIRTGSGVFRNPSGTQQALSLQQVGGGAALSAALGRFDVAAAILGTVATANLSARLMTNPRFVRWLAMQTRAPAGAFPAQLQALAKMAGDDRDIALAVGLLENEQVQENN